jgi:hypothetical protein
MRTIAELLERSRIYMQLAGAAADPYVKERLRTHALALARRAEIDREEEQAEKRAEPAGYNSAVAKVG